MLTLGVFAIPAVFAWMIATSGVPYAFMDLNDDGSVSLREAFRSMDYRVRDVSVAAQQCVEIFDLKDGLTVKTICPET